MLIPEVTARSLAKRAFTFKSSVFLVFMVIFHHLKVVKIFKTKNKLEVKNMKENKNFNHLSLDQRHLISEGLMNGKTFTAIAQSIGVDRTTVVREIKRNRQATRYDQDNRPMECIHFDNCDFVRCKGRDHCPQYMIEPCRFRDTKYVCHRCNKKASCKNMKYYYSARIADNQYHKNLVETRSGPKIAPEKVALLNDILTDNISSKKQSPYHIYASNERIMPICLATLYDYIKKGILNTKYMHLPKAVSYKQRDKVIEYSPTDAAYKAGRTYDDYKKHLALTHPEDVVQMDTVLGKINEKAALLTLLFEKSNLLIAIKLETKTAISVRQALRSILKRVGKDIYSMLFGIQLTDNGSEFKSPKLIEQTTPDGEILNTVFYCDVHRSTQKAKIENCHRLIRLVIPRGTSLSKINQDKVSLMCHHINSLRRESLNGISAYDAFVKQYGLHIADLLGLERIPDNEVCLNESLII